MWLLSTFSLHLSVKQSHHKQNSGFLLLLSWSYWNSHLAIGASLGRATTTAVADDMGSGPSAHAAYSCPVVLLGLNPRYTILSRDILLTLWLGGSNRTHLIKGSSRPIVTWNPMVKCSTFVWVQ